MKKFLQLATAVVLTFTAVESKAQLADGSIAPDWTFTDLNSVSHNLYTYLNAGKTVFIDVSATWCGPCWGYHTGGALENLYNSYGPTGTNELMVFYIEGDGATTLADLQGTTGGTQGDWITGTPYPIVNPSSGATTTFNNNYDIGYFPTIYMVCPNRVITEVGQLSTAALYAAKGSCPAPASVSNDPAILQYTGTELTCGNVNMSVQMQNNGTGTLTAATITAFDGATPVGTVNWVGSLATYAVANVSIGSYTISANTNLTFTITSADGNASNNSITKMVNFSSLMATTNSLTVKITTDRYGAETTWKIFNSAGSQVAAGGPYTNQAANGAYPQPDVIISLPNDCYSFEVYDSYGDGFTGAYGNGSAIVVSAGTNVFNINAFSTSETGEAFRVNFVGIEENTMVNNVSVYPNPMTTNATVDFNLTAENNVSIVMVNTVGQVILNENLGNMSAGVHNYSMDASSLSNGLYFLNINVGNSTITKKVSINK